MEPLEPQLPTPVPEPYPPPDEGDAAGAGGDPGAVSAPRRGRSARAGDRPRARPAVDFGRIAARLDAGRPGRDGRSPDETASRMRVRLLTSLLLACLFLAGVACLGARRDRREKAGHRRPDRRAPEEDRGAPASARACSPSEIAVVTSKIRALQDDVDSASARLDQLENVLALHQRKLDRLNQLYRIQTRKLVLPAAPAQGRDGAAQQAARRRSTPPTRPPRSRSCSRRRASPTCSTSWSS